MLLRVIYDKLVETCLVPDGWKNSTKILNLFLAQKVWIKFCASCKGTPKCRKGTSVQKKYFWLVALKIYNYNWKYHGTLEETFTYISGQV